MREKMVGIFCYNYSPKASNVLHQLIQYNAVRGVFDTGLYTQSNYKKAKKSSLFLLSKAKKGYLLLTIYLEQLMGLI
ncbi:hypothetical protein Y190_04040 [Listeria monocytogenes]|nr:hypothetical protein [Listeria monocytogenes]MOA86275.1 hypothetical protein [Listeria monocytogenes]RKA37458.1 hypothetical protein DYZ90_00833 [Listeria monocytogenes]